MACGCRSKNAENQAAVAKQKAAEHRRSQVREAQAKQKAKENSLARR